MEKIICSAQDCLKEVKQQGLCGMHAQRLWRTGRLDKKKGKYHIINQTKYDKGNRRGYLEAITINDLKVKARKRRKAWSLLPEQAFELITSRCNYCNFQPNWPESRVGIDRVDNAVGYTMENCVPCCFTCNSAKGSMTLDEFIAWIRRVYSKLTA